MPGICLHRELAWRLRDCEQFQKLAAFPLQDPILWQAFLAGSAGPDMGVFPGGVALISDLAHYERSGELCKALVAEARTDRQRAYAWGWVAHVMADQVLHPVINRGVGSYLNNDPVNEIAYAANPCAHVQVELGLDAYWVVRSPRCVAMLSTPPLRESEFPEIATLTLAYARTYGGADFHRSLARSRIAIERWTGSWLRLARRHSNRRGWSATQFWNSGLAELVLLPGRIATCLFPRQSAVRGMWRAIPPQEWLVADCVQQMHRFEELYLEQLAAGLPHLLDYNLDTGKLDGPISSYPLAVRAHEALHRLNGEKSLPSPSARSE